MNPGKIVALAFFIQLPISLALGSMSLAQDISPSEPAILPLRPESEFVPDQVLPKDVRYLPDEKAVESYLIAMDGAPPPWEGLAGPEGVGDEEGLAKLNAKRDQVRQTRRLSKQRIAFLWFAKLLEYDEVRGGFTLSFGPEMYNTSWGEVRFRPEQLPLFFIAVPPDELKETLRQKVGSGALVPVRMVLLGRLSSFLYGFSHEHRGVGSVIPRVLLDEIMFFLVPEPA